MGYTSDLCSKVRGPALNNSQPVRTSTPDLCTSSLRLIQNLGYFPPLSRPLKEDGEPREIIKKYIQAHSRHDRKEKKDREQVATDHTVDTCWLVHMHRGPMPARAQCLLPDAETRRHFEHLPLTLFNPVKLHISTMCTGWQHSIVCPDFMMLKKLGQLGCITKGFTFQRH